MDCIESVDYFVRLTYTLSYQAKKVRGIPQESLTWIDLVAIFQEMGITSNNREYAQVLQFRGVELLQAVKDSYKDWN